MSKKRAFEHFLTQYRQHIQAFQDFLGSTSHSDSTASSSWSNHEKDAFFHALRLYSRWRPDLIAEHMRTRNAVEVCAYIDALDDASAQHRHADEFNLRRSMESARQMSETWVAWEEEQAQELCSVDPMWETAALLTEHHAILKAERAHIFNDESLTVDERSSTFDAWTAERLREWEQLHALESLDKYHLKVMSAMLHRAGLSEAETPAAATASTAVSAPVDRTSGLVPADREQASLGQQYSSTRTPSPGPKSQDDDLAQMSPTSRRRLRKRLHMRRKRAEKAGAVVQLTTEKLRPGRRTKDRIRLKKLRPREYKTRTSRASSEGAGAPVTGPDADTPDGEYISEPGTTKPYKIKASFAEKGVDSHTLGYLDLDLFHLTRIDYLMRSSREGQQLDKKDKTATAISYRTLQILKSIVIDFVTEAVQRAIVLRELELTLKSTKVWRMKCRDMVVSNTVRPALSTMGFFLDGPGTSDDMDGIPDDDKSSHNDDGGGENIDDDGDDDEVSVDEEDHDSNEDDDVQMSDLSDTPIKSTFREDPEDYVGIQATLTRLPDRLVQEIELDTLIEEDEDSEMEAEVMCVLQEEELLENADADADKIFETNLWEEING
ncbi:hypothetical protein FISHEDRAFT_71959 [Fistulina hepatica ATCC 64428]|uniref:Uncharacterized protein n=1 Tax=Fistulina hepatica ATCC 64428 TaxID=1128425 RepID=A0A0D7AJ56_9AGAR|nr:hypothetical protein FISHEDRAFT_71959 [Fistulina hepatica ATCC 64428]